jgi:hypothetical protein
LLERLEDIAHSLERTGRGLALIGLGSVGLELERLDACSDLDFFAIVEPGSKPDYLQTLDWLAAPAPITYAFPNTADGFKYLYADGIFCEMAVFEPEELADIPFAPGRVVWRRADVDLQIAQPRRIPAAPQDRDLDWLLGEALTNLYVGLQRERRGEKLSALRFIQGYALDRLVELAARVEQPGPALEDPFTPERRFELRFPHTAGDLASFAQGYRGNRESARAILAYLDGHFEINPAMKRSILELC